jgi:DNA-binding GntR family transcriptional regulator
VPTACLIYLHHITDVPLARPPRQASDAPAPPVSLSARAYREIRRMIVRLDLAPGAVIRDDELQQRLGLGRTPIREALQRLERDQFVTVIPRRGMYVSNIDVGELATLYETRAIIEPYAARLACVRGTSTHWDRMRAALDAAHVPGTPGGELIEHDRTCHEIVWEAADNRFLTDTLDMLYAQSDRLWHMYLADVDDMAHAVDEHTQILDALVAGDGDRAASLTEAHIRSFDAQIRNAVERRLRSPLAG